MWKLRPREVYKLAWSHTASECWSQDSNLRWADARAHAWISIDQHLDYTWGFTEYLCNHHLICYHPVRLSSLSSFEGQGTWGSERWRDWDPTNDRQWSGFEPRSWTLQAVWAALFYTNTFRSRPSFASKYLPYMELSDATCVCSQNSCWVTVQPPWFEAYTDHCFHHHHPCLFALYPRHSPLHLKYITPGLVGPPAFVFKMKCWEAHPINLPFAYVSFVSFRVGEKEAGARYSQAILLIIYADKEIFQYNCIRLWVTR